MATSIFLARLIGPVFLVTGIGILINRSDYLTVAEEFLGSRALIYLAGLLAIAPGLAIVLTHNVWTADWRVIITLLGWISTIVGAIRILFPKQVTRIAAAMITRESGMTVSGGIMAVLGAILCFFGYLR